MPRTRANSKKQNAKNSKSLDESSENESSEINTSPRKFPKIYPALPSDSTDSDNSSLIAKSTKNVKKVYSELETTTSSDNEFIDERMDSFSSFDNHDHNHGYRHAHDYDHIKSNSSENPDNTITNEFFSNINIIYVAIFIALIAAIIGVAMDFTAGKNSNQLKGPKLSAVELFNNDIATCQNTSKLQNKWLWRNIKSYKTHISDNNPRQPAVLMFASTVQARQERENLAKLSAKAYSHKCNERQFHIVNGRDYVSENWEKAKQNLDNDILKQFHSDGSCALIVSNFEKLPPASTELFYSYCENDNAPYKSAAVIFTVEVEDDWSETQKVDFKNVETDHKKWDRLVDSYLTFVLSKDKSGVMNENVIGGLMARITPVVSWVNPEENLNC